MFQIATTIALALRNGSRYVIPQTFFDEKRKIAFTHFPLAEDDGIVSTYNEPAFTYSEIPYHTGICLNGYFQSEKYFSDFRSEIISAFGLPYEKKEKVVSLHVRRGDYMGLEDLHPFVGKPYIGRAIDYFLDWGYKNFLVFSDDIEWCKREITESNFPFCKFEYSEGLTEAEDIAVMSSCEHNIISNSSFSWWGAWLNQNPNKMVVAPQTWFGKSMNHDTRDLIPSKWIRL